MRFFSRMKLFSGGFINFEYEARIEEGRAKGRTGGITDTVRNSENHPA